MRRSLPAALHARPPSLSSEAASKSPENELLSVELQLECVTPVVGGGVEPYEPDRVDVIRVPGIRGQLRAYWRALAPSPISVQKLFESEIAVWGGVTEKSALRSRVEISVAVDPARNGRDVPAGWHEPRPNGGFSALPKWSGDPARGYALFPLQRPREYLDNAAGNTPRVPTRSVREALAFTLRLRVERRMEKGREIAFEPSDVNRLLGALFCWVHLGGLGGRTTRGFGALALRAPMTFRSATPELRAVAEAWGRLFAGPARPDDVGRWWKETKERAGVGGSGRFEWPTLHGAELFAGPPQASAEAAHSLVLGELRSFRQGERVGRDPPGSDRRPGRSRWPEPDMLRRTWQGRERFRWDHAPEPSPPGGESAPRAAFGLPIVVSFKDRNDAMANATVEIDGAGEKSGGRWISPLRIRPLRCADGRWIPLALALQRRPGANGESVRIVFKKKGRDTLTSPVKVRGSAGAKPPIVGFLAKRQGDAVGAFLEWLGAERRFTRVGGGT